MKQQIGVFFYHFWTKATLKFNRYYNKETLDPLEEVTDNEKRIKILETLMATECYRLLCCIVTGILQLLCLKYEGNIKVSNFRYLRTPSKPVLSEASIMAYDRHFMPAGVASGIASDTIQSYIRIYFVLWQKEGNHHNKNNF